MREEPFVFLLKPLIKTLIIRFALLSGTQEQRLGSSSSSSLLFQRAPADTSASPVVPFKAPLDFSLIFQPGCVWNQLMLIFLPLFLSTKSCFSSPSGPPLPSTRRGSAGAILFYLSGNKEARNIFSFSLV